MEATALVTRPPVSEELTVEQIVAQTLKIQQCMEMVMKKDQHYGVIPGTNTKPTLLKPGAEKLCLLFRLDPEYEVIGKEETRERISYMVRCTLFHIPTSNRIASGLGSCNSREEKYMRPAPKKCPNCDKETIFKSKDERGGWFCWAKKGGCGKTYKDGDESVEKQDTGLKDPADLANTILKMACKRALIAAVLNGTAASDFFTQDLEDLTEKAAEYIPPQAKEGSGPLAQSAATRAAPVSSGTSAAAATKTTPTTSGGTGSKAPRANTIKHDGTFANHKQVTLLHVMRSKVGGLVWCKDSDPCWNDDKTQRAKILCAYHKQLAAFKDCGGKPITSSVDLSEAQISNLIDRYDAKIQQQEARARETPDIGAAFDQAEENARLRGMIEEPGAEG